MPSQFPLVTGTNSNVPKDTFSSLSWRFCAFTWTRLMAGGPVHSVACTLSPVYPLQVLLAAPAPHLSVNCPDCQQNIKTAAARAKLTLPPVSSALQLIVSRSPWPMGTSVFHLFSPQMWTLWRLHLRNTLKRMRSPPQIPPILVFWRDSVCAHTCSIAWLCCPWSSFRHQSEDHMGPMKRFSGATL